MGAVIGKFPLIAGILHYCGEILIPHELRKLPFHSVRFSVMIVANDKHKE